MEDMTKFEKQAIDYLLHGDESWKNVLRTQVPFLKVIWRHDSVLGDSIKFQTPNAGRPLKERVPQTPEGLWVSKLAIDLMKHPLMPLGGSVDLWLNRDGYIDYMEMTSYGDEPWPKDAELKDFQILY